MDGAGAGGAARERRKQLTAAEAVSHKRQLVSLRCSTAVATVPLAG